MTREEADEAQKALDEYVELRDRSEEKKYKIGDTLLRGRPVMLRLQLARLIESMLPEAKLGTSMDLIGLAVPFASILGIKVEMHPAAISVVDGHGDVDPEEIGWDEFERLYCISVPGDVMKEAFNIRSSRVMHDLAAKGDKGDI